MGRKQGDCLYCHSAHRGPNTYDALRYSYRPSSSSTLASDQAQGDYALECFACHSGVAPSGFATAPANIKQFITTDTAGAGHGSWSAAEFYLWVRLFLATSAITLTGPSATTRP